MNIKKYLRFITTLVSVDDKTIVGDETYIGRYTDINESTIGKFCSIGPGCKIGLYNHPIDKVTTHPFINHKSFGYLAKDFFPSDKNNKKKEVNIGNDVWLGTNVIVLRGVDIGDGAVVGAGAVVTKNVPPYAVVVGNPSRIIKFRFSKEEISMFERIKWWDWSKKDIKRNINYFYDVNNFLNIFKV